MAGDKALPTPDIAAMTRDQPSFSDTEFQGKKVRVVSVLTTPTATSEVQVSVAETLNKRRSMMNEILLAVVLPQLLLVFIVGFHIWTGVNRGLRPLHALARLIGQRSARELDAMKPALAHIKNAADRVAHLSTQLLALARSESAMYGVRDFRPLNLTEIVRTCCMEWVPKALERNMDLSFEAARETFQIDGNETLLRELLGNLIDNAMCYGTSGGQIAVKIEVQPHAILIVEDDGEGLDPGEVERVFERFYRVPGSSGQGCGLGLAIVKEIADLHGAQVFICGRPPGGGTRVEIVFGQVPAQTNTRRV